MHLILKAGAQVFNWLVYLTSHTITFEVNKNIKYRKGIIRLAKTSPFTLGNPETYKATFSASTALHLKSSSLYLVDGASTILALINKSSISVRTGLK
jgi:hypothetical protein